MIKRKSPSLLKKSVGVFTGKKVDRTQDERQNSGVQKEKNNARGSSEKPSTLWGKSMASGVELTLVNESLSTRGGPQRTRGGSRRRQGNHNNLDQRVFVTLVLKKGKEKELTIPLGVLYIVVLKEGFSPRKSKEQLFFPVELKRGAPWV